MYEIWKMNPSIRKKENLHIYLWLFKDFAWLADFHYIALTAAVPTVILAFVLMWQSRSEIVDFIHNISVALWILANVIWMIGEFYFDDGTRKIAAPFFILGLLILTVFYFLRWWKPGLFIAKDKG